VIEQFGTIVTRLKYKTYHDVKLRFLESAFQIILIEANEICNFSVEDITNKFKVGKPQLYRMLQRKYKQETNSLV
jgi:hypothetical protein